MNTTDAGGEDLAASLKEVFDQLGQAQTALERGMQAQSRSELQNGLNALRAARPRLDKTRRAARLVSEELRQFQELTKVSALLTSSLDVSQVLEEVMDTVIRLTGAERAYLMLQMGDGSLKVKAARDWDQETLTQEEATFSRGIIQTALAGGVPVVTTNAQADERFQNMNSVFSNDLRSVIIVPLLLKERVVGVLYADNRVEQAVFSQEMVPLLTAFANQAAIAISNARIFERVQDELKQAQSEVERLRIQIDKKKVEASVREVTESDYFRDLNAKVREMRGKTDTQTD
jgi:transcriptional regulator with GAF, ATPase, and Fis domain